MMEKVDLKGEGDSLMEMFYCQQARDLLIWFPADTEAQRAQGVYSHVQQPKQGKLYVTCSSFAWSSRSHSVKGCPKSFLVVFMAIDIFR